MHDLLETFIRHARSIWRFRWYGLASAWLVCLVGWSVIMQMPDEYKASARIYIDTQSILRPLLRGLTVSTDPRRRVELMTRTLLSRPNLERLAQMSDLDLQVSEQVAMDSVIDQLARDIRISSTKKQDLYSISYDNQDRDVAKRVVQSIITIWLESAVGEKQLDTDSAQEFIDEQIRAYEAKLAAAEERLAEFKRKNVGLLPGGGADYFGRMQQATQEWEQAKLALREAENRRRAQKRQLQDLEDEEDYSLGLFSNTNSASVSAIDARIQTLKSQMDELLLKYTDNHPDVIEIRRLVEELERQRQEELELMAEMMPASTGNPLAQQMKLVMGETEAQIASMRVRVAEYEQRVEKLKELVDTIPGIEAELGRLNRDYGVHKRNYQELLQRREAVSLSEKADVRGEDIKIRIIDPPRVPYAPSGPNRPVLMSGVFIAALAAGFGIAFVLYQVRPTFNDPKQVKEITGIPVLGSVSMVRTEEYLHARRWSLAAFAVGGVALLAVYGSVTLIELLDIDLLAALANVVGRG